MKMRRGFQDVHGCSKGTYYFARYVYSIEVAEGLRLRKFRVVDWPI